MARRFSDGLHKLTCATTKRSNRMRQFIKRMRSRPPFTAGPDESYFDKLLRNIPADIVTGYVALSGLLSGQTITSPILHWIVFSALLGLTPLYVCFMKTQPPGFMPNKIFPCVASAFAFAVWVFALGGPFAATWPEWYLPVYGSIALILTTLILPVLEKIFYNDTPPTS